MYCDYRLRQFLLDRVRDFRRTITRFANGFFIYRSYFRLCERRTRRADSHGRRSLAVGNEGALLDSTANRGPIQGEPNTRGHGSFRRLLSSIISPARGRPRVVSPRGALLLFLRINPSHPRAGARGPPFHRFLSPSSFRVYLISPGLVSRFFHRPLHGHPIRILTGACLVVCGATVFPRKKRIDKGGAAVCCARIVANQ